MLRRVSPTALLATLLTLVATPCLSEGPASIQLEGPVDDAANLTPRQIYEKVLEKNRLHSFFQELRVVSADRGGHIQEMKLLIYWKDFRDANDEATKGVLSKALVRYVKPFDLRHYGYLLIQNDGRLNDQFAYFPSFRKVRRVNLRRQSVFGTDFRVDDILPEELEDAAYTRLPDDEVDGVRSFLIEATPTRPGSGYSRFLFYIDSDRYIPLRTRYWDDAGVEVKELKVDVSAIEDFGKVSIPMKITMTHLRHESLTSLEILEFVANPELSETDFEVRRLEAH